MLIFVIICHLFLTLLNLYLVRCLWVWQKRLQKTTLLLNQLTSQLEEIFADHRDPILPTYEQIIRLQDLYQQWFLYLRRFRQVLRIIAFGFQRLPKQRRKMKISL